MQYRFLGRTGVKVSPIAFGTMTFGKEADEEESAALFSICRDAGINIFDCADIYVGGRSEEILGRLIQDCREDVVITSKAFFPTGCGLNDMGASRYHIMNAVEASLRRLRTDRIDIYFIHRFDGQTPLEETLRALDDLVSQGKILYPGASNFAAWQIEKALGISAKQGWASLAIIQPMYNLIKRQAEVEILPMAEAEGLGVLAYSPLGMGLLSGKYSGVGKPKSGRLLENEIYRARYSDDQAKKAAKAFVAFTKERGFNPASLAVAWVMSHPAVTAPIVGARNQDQLRSILAAIDIKMTPGLRAEISMISPEPPPATDRSEERTRFHFPLR